MPDQEFFGSRSGSAVPHAGTYRRRLPVSLERIYENALDWERLPHVHGSIFADARCLDAGAWGWRAALTARDGRESVVELCLDRSCRRWVTRTLEGAGAGAEIWTHAFPVAVQAVDLVVDFFVPGVVPEQRPRVGEACARYYRRLCDEDVVMMAERQTQLDRRLERTSDRVLTLELGPLHTLDLPMPVQMGGRDFVLAEVEGRLAAYPRQCPHMLGPLDSGVLEGRVVTCPWHGDRFDVITGENLSGRPCRLSHLPQVTMDADGRITVTAAHRSAPSGRAE